MDFTEWLLTQAGFTFPDEEEAGDTRAFHLPGRHDQKLHGRRGPGRWGDQWPGAITVRPGEHLTEEQEGLLREWMASIPRRWTPSNVQLYVTGARTHFPSNHYFGQYQPKTGRIMVNLNLLRLATGSYHPASDYANMPSFFLTMTQGERQREMRHTITHEAAHAAWNRLRRQPYWRNRVNDAPFARALIHEWIGGNSYPRSLFEGMDANNRMDWELLWSEGFAEAFAFRVLKQQQLGPASEWLWGKMGI